MRAWQLIVARIVRAFFTGKVAKHLNGSADSDYKRHNALAFYLMKSILKAHKYFL